MAKLTYEELKAKLAEKTEAEKTYKKTEAAQKKEINQLKEDLQIVFAWRRPCSQLTERANSKIMRIKDRWNLIL